jgi:hypothetical protein
MSVASSVTIAGDALGARPAVEIGSTDYSNGRASVSFGAEAGTMTMVIRVEAWQSSEAETVVRAAVGGITPEDAAHVGRALLAFAKSGGAQ